MLVTNCFSTQTSYENQTNKAITSKFCLLYTSLFAPTAGAALSRAPQSATPPLRFSGKLSARQGRTR